MRHIAGVGLLGGMGFTMSIFIAGLGFGSDSETLITAKTAILLASVLAGVSGFAWLRFPGKAPGRPADAQSTRVD
jgi:NhaA family Na+:H+ antiporter